MFVNNKILFIFINKLKLKLKDKFMWRNKKEDSTGNTCQKITRIREVKNKYDEDIMVILYPSPSNIFPTRGMEFFSHPSNPSLPFLASPQKEQGDHSPCLPLQSSWTVHPLKRTGPQWANPTHPAHF